MTRRLNFYFSLLAIMALSASADLLAAGSPPQNSRAAHFCGGHPTLEGGIGVGKLKLGMPVTEMIKVLGVPTSKPTEGTVGGAKWLNLYYLRSSDIDVFTRDSQVVEVLLGNGASNTRGCKTREGIGIGVHMADNIARVYGNPDSQMQVAPRLRFVVYNTRGIAMYMNTEGELLAIELFAPGTFCKLNSDLAVLGWNGIDCNKLSPSLK